MKPTCPMCDVIQHQKPIRVWDYIKNVSVSQYLCKNCKNGFRLYQSRKKSWTIPKRREDNQSYQP